MSDSKSSGLLGGMIIGGALGAIAGILAAPRTGKETRHILKKSADALPELAEDLATSIQFQADRLSEGSLSNWDQTLIRLREAVVAGKAASRQEWVRNADGFTTAADDTSPERGAQSATGHNATSDAASDIGPAT